MPLCAVAGMAAEAGGDGDQTYRVSADGTVDWFTFNGYRRYGASCLHCHGADGLGSTFAPAMIEPLKGMTYREFARIVEEGQITHAGTTTSVMPPFAADPNVKCYMVDLYIYLRARADSAIPRGRPSRKESQPESAAEAERNCMQSFAARTH